MITQEPIPMGIPPNQSSYTHYSHLITTKKQAEAALHRRSIGLHRDKQMHILTQTSRRNANPSRLFPPHVFPSTPTARHTHLQGTKFAPPSHQSWISPEKSNFDATLIPICYEPTPHRTKRNPTWTRFQHIAVPTRRGKRTAQYCRATPYSRTGRHPIASFKNCLYICHNSNSKAL